jgi:MoxR-like ATPase
MQTTINEMITVNHTQAAALILANPDVRYNLRGEPGVGKSMIAKEIARATGYPLSMIDVPNLDLGDVAMPVIDHESRTTRYYPNARFKMQHGTPVVCCLDEFTKGADPVKNMLHPMLEVFDPRLGDVPVPEGSIIFMTGNLDSDGVGDSLKAHTKQRIVTLNLAKPSAEQWLPWAAVNDIVAIVMAYVDRYPHCLASYLDGDQDGNELIFNPNKPQEGCLSPRVLEIISRIIRQRHLFDEASLYAAMAGIGGRPAAEGMSAFIRHQDALPPFADIESKPSTTRIPEDPGALAVLTFGLLERVTAENLGAILTYLRRADEEWQCIFCINLARHKTKSKMAFTNRAFTDWARDNEDLL